MINTAYVREDVKDRATRPVMFVFNGGPGASSPPLHRSAFGPRRIGGEPTQRKLIDNPYSPLDSVDLVFVDPVGTGFSRPLAECRRSAVLEHRGRRRFGREFHQVVAQAEQS